mmetsp:Transcript_42887/g.101819  ORF Transcript_42887/g.101819 Transcript_42887/m.101819 type:complete len:250 (+) Transcript_42887:2650-3399(+)
MVEVRCSQASAASLPARAAASAREADPIRAQAPERMGRNASRTTWRACLFRHSVLRLSSIARWSSSARFRPARTARQTSAASMVAASWSSALDRSRAPSMASLTRSMTSSLRRTGSASARIRACFRTSSESRKNVRGFLYAACASEISSEISPIMDGSFTTWNLFSPARPSPDGLRWRGVVPAGCAPPAAVSVRAVPAAGSAGLCCAPVASEAAASAAACSSLAHARPSSAAPSHTKSFTVRERSIAVP